MALKDEILTLKNKEGTLTGNKVCNFAYDDTAFEDDTTTGANGVTTYNYNNHNNIPVKDHTVLKTNATIISKGFRSQVSVLPRMLLNHIFGRVSYNLNKTVDTLNSLLSNIYNYIGQPNGLATLDNTGRLPYSQLPLSAVEYKGAWNANTNTPTLASGTGTFGDEYIVSVQGTQNLGEGSITYRVGDRVIYNGSIWQRIPASSVRTVNSKTPDVNGNVTVNASDTVTPDVYGYDRRDIGKIWTQGSVTTGTFRCVYYADGIWVAGGNNGLYWSTDGKTWTQGNVTTGTFRCVYYANGIWVAGRDSNGLYWSTDGKTWTQGSVTTGTFRCVYYADGIWVAGRNDGLYWSTDGKTWTQGSGATGTFYCVHYADGIWVAGGGLYWSTDGKTWTQGSGATGTFRCVYYSNGLWVAGRESNGLYWSTDGKTWTQGNVTTGTFDCVYYADGIWVASGNGLYWSTDGKTWTQGSGGTFYYVYYAGGIWVAGGIGLYWSTDGKTWTQGNVTTDSFYCIYYANGLWVAGRESNGLYYSIGSLTNNVATILDWLLYAVDNLLN